MATKGKTKSPTQQRASTVSTSLDVEALRQIVELLETSEISRLDWANGDEHLSIRRGPMHVPASRQDRGSRHSGVSLVGGGEASSPVEVRPPRPSSPVRVVAESANERKGHVITSPFVGTFYRSPAPDQPSYAEVGTAVKKGQVLCIIEAMKLMNEIESEVTGKVAEVLVQNGQAVEFGQPLFRIEPA